MPPQQVGWSGTIASMSEDLMEQIASDEVLEEAYCWLCKRREHYYHNDEVWRIRAEWPVIRAQIQMQLGSGSYSFSPLTRIHRQDDSIEIWTARDALVLKAISIVLTRYFAKTLSSRCTHLAGNGGAKAAVRQVVDAIPENQFVFRTDVKAYYASIRHDILLDQLQNRFEDQRLLASLRQYLQRTVYDGGIYEDVEQGISLGCPLSPLMGALFLDVLDKRMEDLDVFYVRFMDDWVVLAPSRWKLRKAIRVVNQTLEELCVSQHPDKTYIGRISRGFSFLGYEFNEYGLFGIARPTREKFVERVHQLYEQGASMQRIGDYVRRWWIWVRSGLSSFADWIIKLVVFDGPLVPIPSSLNTSSN